MNEDCVFQNDDRKQMIYLDNAATTLPKPESVYAAVEDAVRHCASVGRSSHQAAQLAAEKVFFCRSRASRLFDVTPDRVVFTMNATHGINLAIQSLVKPGDRVLVSGFEHNAVVRPLYHLGAELRIAGRKLFDPEDTLREFRVQLETGVDVAVCTCVSNVFGYRLPFEEISKLCHSYDIPLILDGAQAGGILDLSMKKLQVAYLALPGHKGLFGPQGTGLLLCNEIPNPVFFGGTGGNSRSLEMPYDLPDRVEAGTHNVPGIAGLDAGMTFVAQRGTEEIFRHETKLRKLLAEELMKITDVCVYSGDEVCQTGVLSFVVKGVDCELVAQRLSEEGIAVRAGLHCAPLAHESTDTITTGTVRVSISALNTEGEVAEFLSSLRKILKM